MYKVEQKNGDQALHNERESGPVQNAEAVVCGGCRDYDGA